MALTLGCINTNVSNVKATPLFETGDESAEELAIDKFNIVSADENQDKDEIATSNNESAPGEGVDSGNDNSAPGEDPDSGNEDPAPGDEDPEPSPGEDPDSGDEDPSPEEGDDDDEKGNDPDSVEPYADGELDEDIPVEVDENEEEIEEDDEETDYLVKIKWGNMKFVYDYGGKWNPATHSYDVGSESNEEDPGWAMKYVDGVNNRIVVENKSQYPVTITCTYIARRAFNSVTTNATSVAGAFSESNDTVKSIAWDDSRGYDYVNNNSKEKFVFVLDTNPSSGIVSTTDNQKTFYFTLCGTPDKNRMTPGADTKAGTIKVKVAPYE